MKNLSRLRKTQQENKRAEVFSYVLPVLIAIIIFFLVKYVFKTIIPDPLAGYVCPTDIGPGSAHDACIKSLAKKELHAMFVIYTMPALVCSMIVFSVFFPKIIKYRNLIRCLLVLAALSIGGYYIVKDYHLILSLICYKSVDFCWWLLSLSH